MIMIRDYFRQIFIPDTESYAIYHTEYMVDKDGNVMKELSPDGNEYGDIIIRTKDTKYTFKKVYLANEVVVLMLDYIRDHREDKVIYMDMEKVCEDWEGWSHGELEIEAVK